MILNRDCFFYKKSDFINRQSELSPDSIVYIADTHQIYTHGAFFECALTTAKVKELIESYGYLTPADLPELTGGAAPLEGTYIDGVTVDGHNITIHRGNFSEINVGSASKLENSRDIILSGDISGQVSFDGTKDVTIETTVHNSETADRLTNPRTISLIGQSSGSAYFDGSRDISIETTTNQLNSIDANNQNLNDLVTLNGYLGNLFYGISGNTSLNKPENVDSFGLFTFKSASGNYSTQILGSSLDRIYVRSGADSSLGNWNTLAYLTDNVASATKLQNTRTITLTGDVSGSVSFDGSKNVSIATTVANNSHTHTISNISDLHANWDALLKAAPSGYVTRWPSISEVTGKQNLVIKLNGGTTEGTNQFTFNGVASKSVNITPETIGAQVAGNYMTTDTEQTITGLKISITNPWAVRMTTDTSNYVGGLAWKNTSGTSIAGIGYHNTGKRIFINANYSNITDIWSDAAGKYSLKIGWNELTYNSYPILRSDNYTSYTVTKTGSGASGTWPISVSGNAAGLVNSDPDSFVNRLVYHIEVGGEVGSTEGGGVWGVPSDSQDAQYGQGQYIRMGWPSGTYYTDIYAGPNNAGAARGLQWRQVVANNVVSATHREGWRLLLDTLNYSATLDSRYLLKSSYTAADVLAKLKTVDGSGSRLDADLLDGTHKADLFTALSSTSSTNLSVTIGGTTKTIADLYANYADTAGSVNWINVTNKPDFSEYATVSWVTNNFDSVSISRDQTSGVRIAVINISGTSYSLYAPTAGEVSLTWDSISGKPSCYTPCDHGHHFDDITFNNTGTNRQYLAGDGRFYTISYNEISGTPGQYSLPILSNSILGGAKVNLKHTTSCTFESSHTSTSSSVTVNSRTTVSGRYYAVEADSNGYLFVNVPWEAGESGGGITSINDAAGSSSATGYLITDASGSTVYRRALKSSDITGALGYTPLETYTDTKNTAGATNSTSKLYLVGAPSQSTSPQTYTESGCYISGGQLYSDGKLVATQSWVESNISIDFSMSSTNATNLSLTINGTTKDITNLYADSVDGYDISVVSTLPSSMLTSTIYFVY